MRKILPTLIGSCLKLISLLSPAIAFADCCECPGLLTFGAGAFRTHHPAEKMLAFNGEYKWSASWYGIQPIASAMFTDQGSFYFCFGAAYDIPLGPYICLTPSFAPGVYAKGGGKDLGYPLEFRSSIALSGVFRNGNRLGVQVYHISNASLGHTNPGAEIYLVTYSFAIW